MDVVVYVVGRDCYGIEQIRYGGDHSGSSERGITWLELNEWEITIYRRINDTHYPEVRVQIWKIQEP